MAHRDLFKHKLQNPSRKVEAVTFHSDTKIKPSVFKIPQTLPNWERKCQLKMIAEPKGISGSIRFKLLLYR